MLVAHQDQVQAVRPNSINLTVKHGMVVVAMLGEINDKIDKQAMYGSKIVGATGIKIIETEEDAKSGSPSCDARPRQ